MGVRCRCARCSSSTPGQPDDGTPAFGCGRCWGDDVAVAWEAINGRRLRALVEESHLGIRLSACDCGQPFAVVFTERIDWRGGDDDQTWLAVPLHDDEVTALGEAPADGVGGRLVSMVRGRRFLVRAHPTGGERQSWWRQDGFAIGPHD